MGITYLRPRLNDFSGVVRWKRWLINDNQFAFGLKMAAHFSNSSSALF